MIVIEDDNDHWLPPSTNCSEVCVVPDSAAGFGRGRTGVRTHTRARICAGVRAGVRAHACVTIAAVAAGHPCSSRLARERNPAAVPRSH